MPSPVRLPGPFIPIRSSSKKHRAGLYQRVDPPLHRAQRGVARRLFDVASNPEFLREGTAVQDFLHPDRIVVGADSEAAAALLAAIYEPLTRAATTSAPSAVPGHRSAADLPPLLQTSTKAAELIKHASNAFLAMKISFINVVANLCEAVDANVEHVAKGMGMDRRIGKRFLSAGIGYGGSCFPKDVAAFRSVAQQLGVDFSLLEEVEKIKRAAERALPFTRFAPPCGRCARNVWACSALPSREERTIFASRLPSNSSKCCSTREPPSAAYDPAAIERASRRCPPMIACSTSMMPTRPRTMPTPSLILTDWAEFTRLDLKKASLYLALSHHRRRSQSFRSLGSCRNMGFTYLSIGRPPAHLGRIRRDQALALRERRLSSRPARPRA